MITVFNCSCGPVFGAGADLFIASDCNRNADSYSNLSHSYAMGGNNQSLFGDYNFQIVDYEVFTTGACPKSAPPPPPPTQLATAIGAHGNAPPRAKQDRY